MTLYDNILKSIEDELEKCSRPKYITDLPYDLRSNNLEELDERHKAIEEELKKAERDVERLEGLLGGRYSEENIKDMGLSSHKAAGVNFRTHWRFLENSLDIIYKQLELYNNKANGSDENRDAVIKEWTNIGLGKEINKIYKDLDGLWDSSQQLKSDYESYTENEFDESLARKVLKGSDKLVRDYKELESYVRQVKDSTPKEDMTHVIPEDTYYNPISVGAPRDWTSYMGDAVERDIVRNTKDMPNAYDTRAKLQKEHKDATKKRDLLLKEKDKVNNKINNVKD